MTQIITTIIIIIARNESITIFAYEGAFSSYNAKYFKNTQLNPVNFRPHTNISNRRNKNLRPLSFRYAKILKYKIFLFIY